MLIIDLHNNDDHRSFNLMCQADVYKLLKKNKKKWLSTKAIAKKLNLSTGSICVNLRKLYNQGLIFKKEKKEIRISYIWRIK